MDDRYKVDRRDEALRRRARIKDELLDIWDNDPVYVKPSLWELTKDKTVAYQLMICSFTICTGIIQNRLSGLVGIIASAIITVISLVFLHLCIRSARLRHFSLYLTEMTPWLNLKLEMQSKTLAKTLFKNFDNDP